MHNLIHNIHIFGLQALYTVDRDGTAPCVFHDRRVTDFAFRPFVRSCMLCSPSALCSLGRVHHDQVSVNQSDPSCFFFPFVPVSQSRRFPSIPCELSHGYGSIAVDLRVERNVYWRCTENICRVAFSAVLYALRRMRSRGNRRRPAEPSKGAAS